MTTHTGQGLVAVCNGTLETFQNVSTGAWSIRCYHPGYQTTDPLTDPWTVTSELSPLPPLSIEDGVQIGGAILLVWAIAWGIRQVLNVLGLNK